MNTEHIKRLIDEADRLAAFARNHQLTDMADSLVKHADELRKLAEPVRRVFTPAGLEALSYIITTATEGGHYTREDFRIWRNYKHGDTGEGGRFHAEVTVIPNDDVEGIPHTPIRMTPEELGNRLLDAFERNEVEDDGRLKVRPHHALMIARLVNGDEEIAGECDVIDAGALMQIAVYGEVVYG
jgi:hypothetical protein